MAKAGRRSQSRKRAEPLIQCVEPTPEQLLHGEFIQGGKLATGTNERNGIAYRRVPVIDTLHKTGLLSQRQFDALKHYREKANAADRSPIRSAIDFSLRGSGAGLPHFGVIINREMEYLNEAIGTDNRPTVWAIAIDDKTPSQWAIELFGSVVRLRQRGQLTVHSSEPRRGALRIVQQAICQAGDKLAKAIGA